MKKIISIIILLYIGVTLKAQNNEITLVVNGDGQTKEAATASALRSAIEQAFGTFVSANTTILNDELIKDEIATVTSGNIKSYKEITDIHNPDGTHSVTVSATVSIGNLISYAQSHGSSAEFAGQTFAMNMKMRELNRKNEELALQNMLRQLEMIQNDIFDFELTVKDPHLKENSSSEWQVPMTVTVKPNANMSIFTDIIKKTFSSLSLSSEEKSAYEASNMSYYAVSLEPIGLKGEYAFRNNVMDVIDWICRLLNTAQNAFMIRTVGGIEEIEMPWNQYVFVPFYDREDNKLTIHYIKTSRIATTLEQKMSTMYTSPSAPSLYFDIYDSTNHIPYNLYSYMVFPLDKLSEIQSFEVVKMPVKDIGAMRTVYFLDKIGCPYKEYKSDNKNHLVIHINNSPTISFFIDQNRYNAAYLYKPQENDEMGFSDDEHIVTMYFKNSELIICSIMLDKNLMPRVTGYRITGDKISSSIEGVSLPMWQSGRNSRIIPYKIIP